MGMKDVRTCVFTHDIKVELSILGPLNYAWQPSDVATELDSLQHDMQKSWDCDSPSKGVAWVDCSPDKGVAVRGITFAWDCFVGEVVVDSMGFTFAWGCDVDGVVDGGNTGGSITIGSKGIGSGSMVGGVRHRPLQFGW